jgi:GDPmannose 4,6-dehydratase
MSIITKKKIAFLTGISGQDSSYMADLLLYKGYIVHGLLRRSATFNTQNIDHIFDKLHLHHGDITDTMNVFSVINKVRPDEIYNFAAMSHVKVSAEIENYTFQTNTMGILNVLQAVQMSGLTKTCKIYQASTSEEYGNQTDGQLLLNEDSPRFPVSIYGISKLAADHICKMYRNAFGMFIVSSTLFNHESERRGHTFVTQKIADYTAKFNSGSAKSPLELGNLNAKRDFGYAKDYMEAVFLMVQFPIPDDYVIATGETHSVREFVELSFKCINVSIVWEGTGLNEVGKNENTNEILIKVNSKYYRDIDIECLIGDSSKAKRILDWTPKTSFKELVKIMVDYSIKKQSNK